jgi:hypothetical protein
VRLNSKNFTGGTYGWKKVQIRKLIFGYSSRQTEGLADIPDTSLYVSPHASIFATLQTMLSGFFAYTSCTLMEVAL